MFPITFTMMNYAVFVGFLRWIKGSQNAAWEKASRMKVEANRAR